MINLRRIETELKELCSELELYYNILITVSKKRSKVDVSKSDHRKQHIQKKVEDTMEQKIEATTSKLLETVDKTLAKAAQVHVGSAQIDGKNFHPKKERIIKATVSKTNLKDTKVLSDSLPNRNHESSKDKTKPMLITAQYRKLLKSLEQLDELRNITQSSLNHCSNHNIEVPDKLLCIHQLLSHIADTYAFQSSAKIKTLEQILSKADYELNAFLKSYGICKNITNVALTLYTSHHASEEYLQYTNSEKLSFNPFPETKKSSCGIEERYKSKILQVEAEILESMIDIISDKSIDARTYQLVLYILNLNSFIPPITI